MPFDLCPHCKKYLLPPGMVVVVNANAPDRFCTTQGDCSRIECPGCGFFVNPMYHSQWECDFARRAYEQRGLDEQEVLCEAEAILRDARKKL